MATRTRYAHRLQGEITPTPFADAQEVWFWFIQAQTARAGGLRVMGRQGDILRPCEATDILKIIDRLYRHRLLVKDHLLVLRHYGRRFLPPDPRRAKEYRAHRLWEEAMSRLQSVFERKGIVVAAAPPQAPMFPLPDFLKAEPGRAHQRGFRP